MGDALSCSLWDQISFTKAKQTWCFYFILNISLILKIEQPQEQCYPFQSVCAVFLFVQTMVRLLVFRIFDVPIDACDCTLGLYGHRKSQHWKLTGRKIPYCTREVNTCQYCAWLFGRMLYWRRYCVLLCQACCYPKHAVSMPLSQACF